MDPRLLVLVCFAESDSGGGAESSGVFAKARGDPRAGAVLFSLCSSGMFEDGYGPGITMLSPPAGANGCSRSLGMGGTRS
jgi:hypothetical protein